MITVIMIIAIPLLGITITLLIMEHSTNKFIHFYKMVLDNNFITSLVIDFERLGIEFCLNNNIPIHYMFDSPPDCTYAGQIRYVHDNFTNENYNFNIVINCSRNQEIKHDDKELVNRIELVSRIKTIFHEIGHYSEIQKTKSTTEEGADSYGMELLKSYCDNPVLIKFLNLATSMFDADNNNEKEFIFDKKAFNEIKTIYTKYKLGKVETV